MERSKLPSGVRGGVENGFYAYFRSERSPLDTIFSTFELWWAPNVAGPGKTPPPLSTGLILCLDCVHYIAYYRQFFLA